MGVPMLVTAVDGIAGHVAGGLIDLSLVPEAVPGDWVLCFLGAGREVIDAEQAARISAALAGLAQLMAGGTLGDAFADLEARVPALPLHLQAALDAGRTTG
jgi:hydrogenase expression/formation protein HypC